MKPSPLPCALAALASALALGCRDDAPPTAPAVSDEPAWRTALLAERARTNEEMRTSPLSPLAAVERRILSPSAPTYVRLDGAAAQLTEQPHADALVRFRPPAGADAA